MTRTADTPPDESIDRPDEDPVRPEPEAADARDDDGGAAGKVGAGIFLSRVLGFVRDRVLAHYFGTSEFADAWRAALRTPNVIQNLLGEGTLSASFIPVYAEFLEKGEYEKAGRFAGAALGILAVVASGLALLGVAVAPWLVDLFFFEWDAAKQALTVDLVRILFPMTAVLVVSAWALGVLNSHRKFFVSYFAPVFWSLTQIVVVLAGAMYWGLGQRDLVVALAWGALAGGVLQFGVQLPFVVKSLTGFELSLGRGVAGVREAVGNFMPVVAARGVVNLSGWLDVILAATLAEGAVAVLGYAQTLYVLPISLFGMSVAASELPELSRMRGDGRSVLAERVSGALNRVAYFLVPATVGYVMLGDVVVGALFETGAFGPAQTLVTWAVLGAYSLGLAASARSRVLSSAFYALRDTRRPAAIATVRVVVSAAVGLALMFPLDALGFQRLRLGAMGLAFGASVGAWLEYVLLRRSLGEHIGDHSPDGARTLRLTAAAAVAAGVGVGLQLVLPEAHPILVAAETLVPFGVVYVGVAWLLGIPLPLRRRAA